MFILVDYECTSEDNQMALLFPTPERQGTVGITDTNIARIS
jgi:hypothetical protein